MQVTIKIKTANLFKRLKSRIKGNATLPPQVLKPPKVETLQPIISKRTKLQPISSEEKEIAFNNFKRLLSKKLNAAKKGGLILPLFIDTPPVIIHKTSTYGIMDNIGEIFTASYDVPKYKASTLGN